MTFVTLSEVAEVLSGTGFPTEYQGHSDGDVPFAKVGDISKAKRREGITISSADHYVSFEVCKKLNAKIFPAETIVFAKIGEAIRNGNKVMVARPMIFDNNVMGLVPRKDKIFPRYLYRYVDSLDFFRLANSTTVPSIRKTDMEALQVWLPPLEEQKRIAAILDQADELRRKRQRALDRLNQLGQAIFYEMFGDPKTNPKGLSKAPLGELIKVSSGVGLTASDQNGGDYPVYGGNGVNGCHDDFTVPAGTVVIGRVGVYCGAVHVTDRDAWVTDNALIVTLKQPVNRTYLAAALKIANLNQYAGRSAQPLVSGSRIYPIEILCPPIDQQGSYEARVLQAEAVSVDCAAASKHIDGLFAALQHCAFRGELTASSLKEAAA